VNRQRKEEGKKKGDSINGKELHALVSNSH
jgi:hypothetical protein